MESNAKVDKLIRILFVDENQNGTTGGSHYCLYNLIEKLDKSIFRPIVVVYEHNDIIERLRGIDVPVYIYPRRHPVTLTKESTIIIVRSIMRVVQICINSFRTSIIPLLSFIRFMRKEKIQLVHINNSIFHGLEWFFASRIMGIKIVAHQRGFYDKVPRWYLGYHSRKFDYVISISKSVLHNLSTLGIPPSNCSTIYDNVDVESLKRRKPDIYYLNKLGVGEEVQVVGMVGNVQRWKGQLILIKAINELRSEFPEIKCLIIGGFSNSETERSYIHEIESYIQYHDLSSNIVMMGARNDVPELVNAMQVFIHASIEPEPFGMVVLEAMAARRAIIASNKGGPAEMIENGVSGFLIEPGNPSLLAEKISFLLRQDETRNRFGEDAYKRVCENYSEYDIKELEQIYSNLLSN